MLAIVAPSIRFSLEHVAHNISLSAFCVVCGLTQELTPEEYFGGDTTTSQQQGGGRGGCGAINWAAPISNIPNVTLRQHCMAVVRSCLLYTSDAADEEDSVDLGGRRIIKKKKT
eukprot:TRINITY_DN54665_c0_g1_i1.p2 TRINITY_DN54665_c0_g1~~TRINITY_DN54665_c0_g1_i1.p2  ORF type:complete len:114 (-),score=21.90 TRINITY_DN54665_c0_g1_i1:94-435(-)